MHVEELPPRMCQARCLGHSVIIQPGIAGISIRLQDAAEPGEVLPRMLAFAVRAVAIQHRRRGLPAERLVVAHIAPHPSRLGLAAAGIQHRHRGVVGMHPLRRHHVQPHRLDQRTHQPCALSDPVRQRRAVEVDAAPRVDLRLAIQRQVSRAGEFHPRALPEPYVSLSAHTAPSVQPRPYRSDQWANRSGDERTTRASQVLAPLGRCLKRLNLRRAHRIRKTSIRCNVGYSADL